MCVPVCVSISNKNISSFYTDSKLKSLRRFVSFRESWFLPSSCTHSMVICINVCTLYVHYLYVYIYKYNYQLYDQKFVPCWNWSFSFTFQMICFFFFGSFPTYWLLKSFTILSIILYCFQFLFLFFTNWTFNCSIEV